jgi:two-component system CheB/CheR fusion protein
VAKKKLVRKKIAKKKSSVAAKKDKHPFPVVAIGSSSGGLEAVSALLRTIPPNLGMAFIYVQHLSPHHKSMLSSILSHVTHMKVQEIEDMEKIVPNNVYVIPNNKSIKVTDGHIKLGPRSKGSTPISIDTLFESLAKTHHENVIGIILSGNGSDGKKGLKAIKDEGGTTFAQDGSAQVKSMPNASIDSGIVDFILSPAKIAHKLAQLSKKGFPIRSKTLKTDDNIISDHDPYLKIILGILHKEIKVDFSRYKMATIKRRIAHRMQQSNVTTIKEYSKLLIAKKEEVNILYKDLLINVTNFFRDEETFQYLKTTCLPKILKGKKKNESIRIWIPACSTGEEAYSIAMLIAELQESKKTKIPVQIFATDLSDQAIYEARIGEYSKDDIKSISKKRLAKFFTKTGDYYRISKSLREMCVFAPHNILRDPPFSRIDFISCRNLFIYFDPAAQKKALTVISFSLNDGGYLLLGKSETIGSSSHFFNMISSKHKIYTRKINTGKRKVPELMPSIKGLADSKTKQITSKKNSVVSSTELDSIIDSTLLSHYMPACAIINKDMEIIKFRGLTSLFLSHTSGNATLNILKMARPEFAFELRNAIHETIETNRPVLKSGIELNSDQKGVKRRIVSFEARPLTSEIDEPLFLIVFTVSDRNEQAIASENTKGPSKRKELRANQQIEELQKASAEMVTVIESQEKSLEELQVANEEIVSAGEEYQTLNEELETSKEEIEATNEELQTTNQELQVRNEQLAESYNFAEAIAETMHEPMLILDKHLRVKSANKAFFKKFHVIQANIEGVLLYELGNHQWDIPRLRKLLETIIIKDTFFEAYEITHEFPVIGKKTMLLNARRIVQKTLNEHLILLTFTDTTDVTKKRKAEKKGLEDIIDERTVELEKSYRTLEEKNIFLEKMNQELEMFTYISSHDLQEPLRKIKDFTACLLAEEQEQLSDSGKDYLQRMQNTVKRMQMLIEDLLKYSRVKKGKSEFKVVDLNRIVKEVIADFDEAFTKKKAVITVSGFCEAKIIAFQFRQLISNLISNSLKFSHKKRFPRISIRCEITPGKLLKKEIALPETNYCHITYTDNGIGFDPQYKDRIFEVFQRLHEYDEYKGTGIGLAICKKIIENHKGIITATGRINKGAQFDIYIPALK